MNVPARRPSKSQIVDASLATMGDSQLPLYFVEAVRCCARLDAAGRDGRKRGALGDLQRRQSYWHDLVFCQISSSAPAHPILVIRLAERHLIRALESYGPDFEPYMLTVKLKAGEQPEEFFAGLRQVYEGFGHIWACVGVLEEGRRKGKSRRDRSKYLPQNRHVHALIAWPKARARSRHARNLHQALVAHLAPRNAQRKKARCPNVTDGNFFRYSLGQPVNLSNKKLKSWYENAEQHGLAELLEYLAKQQFDHPDAPIHLSDGIWEAGLAEYEAALEEVDLPEAPDFLVEGTPEAEAHFNRDSAYLVIKANELIDAGVGRREAVDTMIAWWVADMGIQRRVRAA